MQTIISGFLLLSGLFFFSVSTIGLLRLPDVFTRMHATTKGDTLGAGCIMFALMLQMGLSLTTFKILLILVFLWITSPTAAHCIARGVYNSSVKQQNSGGG